MDNDNALICCICHRQIRLFDLTIFNDGKVVDNDHGFPVPRTDLQNSGYRPNH